MARPPVSSANGAASPVAKTKETSAGLGCSLLASLLSQRRGEVLDAWVRAQDGKLDRRSGRTSEAGLRAECTALLDALELAVAGGYSTDVKSLEYADVTQLVNAMSKDRARQGYSPTETAIAVFSLKDALLGVLEEACADQPGFAGF